MGEGTTHDVVDLANRHGREAVLLELGMPAINVLDPKLARGQPPDAVVDVVLDVAGLHRSSVLPRGTARLQPRLDEFVERRLVA
jgi:hypothetical protein